MRKMAKTIEVNKYDENIYIVLEQYVIREVAPITLQS